ncbi:MAG: ATP-grasp domain-containing protein [Flavobacteriales bacterium]|nr:ATP-grasp domain-containing protein [Flavobacteriales bacterium]
MFRPLIAVFRGGYSGESVISHQSARRMLEAIDTERYEPVYVTVSRETWTCERPDGSAGPLDRALLRADLGQGPSTFAAALIAIHGTPGEDGRLQGLLDMLEIPYQTGGVLNMAVTFSKFSTTSLLRQMGFAVANSLLITGAERPSEAHVLAQVGLPCFVKPDQSGSSLGISKVKTPADLGPALDLAFAEGEVVMAEAFVKGRELTCGVIRLNGRVQALPICEVRTSHEFFDYQAKYHATDTEELIPAPLPDAVTRLVQQRSEAIYSALGCRGMVRVDHLWTGLDPTSSEGELFTIEVNTTPGFSPASIYPKMLEVCGIGVKAAVNGLIEECLQRRR